MGSGMAHSHPPMSYISSYLHEFEARLGRKMSASANTSMGSMDSMNYGSPTSKVFCNYGIELPLKTSRSKTNPRKMYWTCAYYGSEGYCGIFKWLDAEPKGFDGLKLDGIKLMEKLIKLENEVEGMKTAQDELKAAQDELELCKKIVVKLEIEVNDLKKKIIVLAYVVIALCICFVGIVIA